MIRAQQDHRLLSICYTVRDLAYGFIAIHNILYEAINIECVFFPIQSVQHPSGYMPKFTNLYHVERSHMSQHCMTTQMQITSIGIEV